MSERKACTFIFLFFLLLSCAGAKLFPEQWYTIPESEVQGLEMVSTALRQDKQTLLSQVTTLLTTAKKLESDSVKLNAQLLTERTSVQSLTKSFDQYEADQYRIMGNFETKIRDLETRYSDKIIELERAKRHRDTLAIFLGVSILLSLIYFYFKIRYKLPI